MILWGDIETFSECDLKTAGVHRYAEHPSTRIIVWQWALDDGEPVVEDLSDGSMPSDESMRLLLDPNVTLVFHNSAFDRTVLRHVWGLDIPVERWQDTMVKALAHGLPGSLDKIGQILGLEDDQAKDKRGRELIQLFCKPRPKGSKLRRATRETHPKEWSEFLEYSRQDIVAMRAIDKRLPTWNYRAGHPELALWHLDQRINDRGIAVDIELARCAIAAVAVEQKRLKAEVLEATDGLVTSASQRDQLLAFICAEYGVDLPDLRADTVRRRLEDPDLPEGVKLLLALRLESSKTSTAKYKALVNAVSGDGRLRNTLQFAGASRTGRWAHRLFQPGNMPRPDLSLVADHFQVSIKEAEDLLVDYLDQGVEALKGGYADVVFDNVIGLTANAVRGCIVAPPGKKLVVADLSNIEGRGLAFLAGERWKLKAFADFDAGTGEDLYNVAYARSFNIAPKEATGQKRQIGKVMELGLGYEGGVAAFLTFAAVYNMDLEALAAAVYATASAQALSDAQGMWQWAVKNKRTLGLPERVYVACEVLKRAWRDAHPNTVALWAAAAEAVRLAVRNPGETFPIGPHLKARRDGKWLRIRLPSGRYLCYLNPEVDDAGQITYFGVNQYTRQWGRIKTYGGKLCLAAGTLVLAKRGWITIENITAVDEVWDGVEWVSTAGSVCNGTREVMEAFGAWMTPDHLVLTTEGWKDASQSEGHHRAACRLPDGVALPRQRREAVAMGCAVRLRSGKADACFGDEEASGARDRGVVRVQAPRVDQHQTHAAWHEQTPGVRGVAQHVRSLPAAVASRLAQLRRAWDHGLRALGRLVRRILGGHGADVPPRADAGQDRQLRGVLAGELPLGNLRAAGQQHADEPYGWRQDGHATCAGTRGEALDYVLPAGEGRASGAPRGSARRVAQVYDLINCGPRHRFVVWAGGAPLIVHNCENATQAFARDVLAYNMPAIEAKGYEIVLSVHDELLTETSDAERFSADELGRMMATVPPWAKGIPLAASGFETVRYRKG